MKYILATFVCLLLLTTASQQVRAQAPAKTDKLIMLNGNEEVGQVTEIGDTYIKFIHQNETLVYTIKKDEINKIQFASGRIEFITETVATKTDPNGALQDHHNVVAVLPVSYIGSGGSRDDKMALKAQSDAYNTLLKQARQFTIQDPMTTNAKLIKNGINAETIAGFTPQEISNMLDVEYVVFSTITVSLTGASTTGGAYSSDKDKGKKTTGFTLGSSSTTNKFTTTVDMKIYLESGENIFSKSHQSFWPEENAYELTLQYLIKRTPLYNK